MYFWLNFKLKREQEIKMYLSCCVCIREDLNITNVSDPVVIACSRLSVSEDDRKRERATNRISGDRDPGEKRRGPDLSFFPTRPHSSPAHFFNPPLTESLEQATVVIASGQRNNTNAFHQRPDCEK